MRYFFIIQWMLIGISSFSQSQIVGKYERMDSKIWINKDSSFRFLYSVDMEKIWSKGIWRIQKKKILLTPIPVYDTLSLELNGAVTKDSLILSRDEIASRINTPKKRVVYAFQVEQSLTFCPQTLYYKKGKLYILKNGKKQKKKINNGFYIKAFDPWYTKTIAPL